MQIVFSLYPYSDYLFLPAAWLVQTDKEGNLTYLSQRATEATCQPYQIEVTPPIARLFQTIETLSPKAIEQHFKTAKSKAITPLNELIKNQNPTKSTVDGYIFRHLSSFLAEVVKNNFHLALHPEKKSLVKDVKIQTQTTALIPHLSFMKKEDGIEYQLQLGTESEKWPISSQNTIALTNTDPAWVLVGHSLFQIPGINGFMVNPFRNKPVIHIPPEQVKVYFKKFIARNAGRNQIEAEGFEIQITNTLKKALLEPIEDVIQNTWVLKPIFEYEQTRFELGEKRNNITTVEFQDSTDQVVVKKVIRDTIREAHLMAKLEKLNVEAHGRVLIPEHGMKNNAALIWWINWINKNNHSLKEAGFHIIPPEINGRKIALITGSIQIQTNTTTDWFDVNGLVTAGAFVFPFKELVHFLQKNDPLFPLPDGSTFLIPEEWFARYSELAKALLPNESGYRLPKALFTLLEEEIVNTAEDFPVIDPNQIDYIPDDSLKATLRPYQLFGVKWLIGHYQHGFGACLADSMGLGKTLQTIALLLFAKKQLPKPSQLELPIHPPTLSGLGLQLDLFGPTPEAPPVEAMEYPTTTTTTTIPTRQPALLILPASLVFNWKNELSKFAPSLFVRIHTGSQREKDPRALAFHDVVLTTYHTARQDIEMLRKINWSFIILDESQQIKNRESEISKVVRSLDAPHKISLSGTPIENSLADLWTQMEFINPAILGNYPKFKEEFQIPIERFNDESAKERLFKRVRPFFLRRTKEEVTPDLPPLTEQLFFSEMTSKQQSRYEEVKSAVRNEILQLFDDPKTRLLAIQSLTKLRQIANHPILENDQYSGDAGKIEDVLAQWETLQKDGHKVLFFSSFTKHLQLYKKQFDQTQLPYCWLTGSTPASEREGIIDTFQNNKQIQAFFCSIKAGGVGLNLTSASYVFLLDPWWNPAAEDQAIARAHRIGQKQSVHAIRFISRNSIEEKIRAMQLRKKSLGQALFATEGEIPAFTRADIEDLLS
jgi:superfamily II DNA or RNA helicase